MASVLSLPPPMRMVMSLVAGSMRRTVPVRISCSFDENVSKTMPRSASRMPWMMTCLAVWAAMRPKAFVCTSTLTRSPSCAVLLILRAASSVISVAGVMTSSTTSFCTYMCISSSLTSTKTLSV